tara:strand:- start:1053 stop:1640 length:588 start_codon:yes stop_codon:yes gene_type:complete
MVFEQVKVGDMQNFSYIVGDDVKCAIVDPGWDGDLLLKRVEELGLEIVKIILTHAHYDHINDVDFLFKKTNAKIFVHEFGVDNILKISKDLDVVGFKNKDVIKVGSVDIKVIHTPGHSKESCCLLFENKLITGDTLFIGSIGRTDFPESNPDDMKKSLDKLKLLDDSIEVWPGHDYGSSKSSTIKDEKEHNPFLK